MKPFFREGDILGLEEAGVDSLKKGNVIVFDSSSSNTGDWVAHRVIDFSNRAGRAEVITQGDNRTSPDDAIGQERIVGRVVARRRQNSFVPISRLEEILCLNWLKYNKKIRKLSYRTYRALYWIGGDVMKKLLLASSDIIFRKEGDEAILFNPESGEIMLLNETGSEIYQLLDGKHNREEIVNLLAENYDSVDREELEKDVDEFIDKMQKVQIVA